MENKGGFAMGRGEETQAIESPTKKDNAARNPMRSRGVR